MSSLLCVACYSTDANGRLEYTKRTMRDLLRTVDFNKHRLGVYLNAPSDDTIFFFNEFEDEFTFLYPRENLIIKANEENVGTALAINSCMAEKTDDEYVIKMDDDCIVNKVGWVDEMEEVIERMPEIGILGLKRRDLAESTYRTDWAKSMLYEVPHKNNERVFVVERCQHVIGTCTMFSKEFTKECGGLIQPSNYGMDDFLACVRCAKIGLWNCFLMGVDILHIDEGSKTPENAAFTKFKQDHAGEIMEEANKMKEEFISGERSVFVPFK